MPIMYASIFVNQKGDKFEISTKPMEKAREYRIQGPSNLPRVSHLLQEFKGNPAKEEKVLSEREMDEFLAMLVGKGFQIEIPST